MVYDSRGVVLQAKERPHRILEEDSSPSGAVFIGAERSRLEQLIRRGGQWQVLILATSDLP